MTCLACRTRFNALCVLIIIGFEVRIYHPVCRSEITLGRKVCRRHFVLVNVADFKENGNCKGVLYYKSQIVCGGVLTVRVKSVRIVKMRVLTAERNDKIVHHTDKLVDISAADIISKGVGSLVCRFYKHTVEKLPDRYLLVRFKTCH